MWAREDSRPAPRDIAVIDVGSNSVRLVLYRVEGRAIWTVFNEKVLAGLGKGVAASGTLSAEGRAMALAALKRFKAVVAGARPSEIFTAATAAVREAADGKDFINQVQQETGLKIRVLSGEDEARYSALGVAAGASGAHGVVGDLGGSSLELTRLVAGHPSGGVTLPLGPFSLGAPKPIDIEMVRATSARVLSKLGDAYACETFYAVGGAWRNLALVHMAVSGYPLRIVHQFEFSASEAVETARFISRQSRGSLERIPGLSKKRVETLPYSAAVLEAAVEGLAVKRISVSAYGVREGLLFESMSSRVQALDPLIEGCDALGVRQGVAERLGAALEKWLTPFWSSLAPIFEPGRDEILLAAACRLADMGARLHPDHRADLTFDQVLRAPIAGQNHAERTFLAAALFARYTPQSPPLDTAGVTRLLSPDRVRRARTLGAALRLGCDLSGRTPELLANATLSLQATGVVLDMKKSAADMLQGEQTRKRLSNLADTLERPFSIRLI